MTLAGYEIGQEDGYVQQLTNRSEVEIRTAISDCLDRCYQSGSPVARLAECLEKLRNSGWDQVNTRRVEVSVLRMLSGLSRDVDVRSN